MNDKDKKTFLEDFAKADISTKLDMWFYAIEQDALWEEIIAEMSMVAQINQNPKAKIVEE